MKKIALTFSLLLACTSVLAGAWGDNNFENDDALDWIGQCVQSQGVSAISTAFDAALKAKIIEAPEGAAAIAAIEVVAASLGKPSSNIPDDLRNWVQHQPREQIAKLAPIARMVIARIKDAKVSELKQQWSEGKTNKWATHIAELEARLGR